MKLKMTTPETKYCKHSVPFHHCMSCVWAEMQTRRIEAETKANKRLSKPEQWRERAAAWENNGEGRLDDYRAGMADALRICAVELEDKQRGRWWKRPFCWLAGHWQAWHPDDADEHCRRCGKPMD